MVSNLTLMMTVMGSAGAMSDQTLTLDRPVFLSGLSGMIQLSFTGEWQLPMDLYAYLEFDGQGSLQLNNEEARCNGTRCWAKVRRTTQGGVTMFITGTAKGMLWPAQLWNQCRGGMMILTESSEISFTSIPLYDSSGLTCGTQGAPACYIIAGTERFTDGKFVMKSSPARTVFAVRDMTDPSGIEQCQSATCEFTNLPAGSLIFTERLPTSWSHVFTGENRNCAENLFIIADPDYDASLGGSTAPVLCPSRIDITEFKCPASGGGGEDTGGDGGDTGDGGENPGGDGGSSSGGGKSPSSGLPLPAIIGGVVGGIVVIVIIVVIVYVVACRKQTAPMTAETTQETETASNTSVAGGAVTVVNNTNNSNGGNAMVAAAPSAPQYQQAPLQYQQVPPQYQQVPPQYQQAPPQYQQAPPQYQQAPPQSQQAPPQSQ